MGIKNGPIPPGLGILHNCDNPPCVCQDHLFPGNQTINNLDMDSKGRRVNPPIHLGESHPNHKVNRTQVYEMRELHKLGWNFTELGVKYNVSKTTTLRICRNKIWTHV